MYALGEVWRDGYLDYHKHEDEVRIRVRAWWILEELHDVFVPQPRDPRRVLNYIREVGVRATLRKIRSRLAERLRDQRVIAVGVGELIEGCSAGRYQPGEPVVFVAPCHPRCVERLVVPADCVRRTSPALLERFRPGDELWLLSEPAAGVELPAAIRGWSRFSGRDIRAAVSSLLEWAERECSRISPDRPRKLRLAPRGVVSEQIGSPRNYPRARRAVLFGLGHYAKTCIIPSLDSRISLECVHELDPMQIGPLETADVRYDTSPTLRNGEKYDVYLIAGYHHTHADLAVRALDSGGWAVVEKPLVTNRAQLNALLDAMRRHPGRLFACFHMRYSPLWEMARQDLGLEPGQPVHYHCIVYEISLATNHWYHWPNSGSRVVSNGCHWLDHFLFMNGFSPPVRWDLWRGGNRDLHVSVELENGAVFGMALTDVGNRRIGVQDHIELRAGNRAVTVNNGSRYRSEDDYRIIRRRRIMRSTIYPRMYRLITHKIMHGEPGDSLESVQTSCELMLKLEEVLQEARSEHP